MPLIQGLFLYVQLLIKLLNYKKYCNIYKEYLLKGLKMRELIEKNQRITMITYDFRNANKGTIIEVEPDNFTIELDYVPEGVLKSNYCEFYTNTSNGLLYFDSYAKEINGKQLKIASPAKHKFLQRRRFTRIKYMLDLTMTSGDINHNISTLDISAGGMRFTTSEKIDIELDYQITLPLSDENSVTCTFSPIRIEKSKDGKYTLSGEFKYSDNKVKLTLIQYCSKRNLEIANK